MAQLNYRNPQDITSPVTSPLYAALKIESSNMDGGSAIKLEVYGSSTGSDPLLCYCRSAVLSTAARVLDTVLFKRWSHRDTVDQFGQIRSTVVQVGQSCHLQKAVLERIHERGRRAHVPTLYRSRKRKNVCYMIITLLGSSLRRIKVYGRGSVGYGIDRRRTNTTPTATRSPAGPKLQYNACTPSRYYRCVDLPSPTVSLIGGA